MKKSDAINPKLIDILVCPLTKGPLTFDKKNKELISPRAKLAYPIRDGVPVMLAEEARPISETPLKTNKATKSSKKS